MRRLRKAAVHSSLVFNSSLTPPMSDSPYENTHSGNDLYPEADLDIMDQETAVKPLSGPRIGSLNETSDFVDSHTRVMNERAARYRERYQGEEKELKAEWERLVNEELSLPGKPMKYKIPSSGDPWHRWHGRIEKFDNGFCGSWKEEIDKHLIFAGLFSAALTAFIVEAFKWLDDPYEDLNTQVMIHLSNQVANASIINSPGMQAVVYPAFESKRFSPSASVIRINIFWFLSLVLSLSSVLIGILCSQWIREYQRDVTHESYRAAIGIRQIRYEGLLKWKVPQLVNMMPVLLLCSVLLFFAGLLDLLFDRYKLIACVVLVPMALIVAFLIFTTAAPCLQTIRSGTRPDKDKPEQCPFKSPQAFLFQKAVLKILSVFSIERTRSEDTSWASLARKPDWLAFDLLFRQNDELVDYYFCRAWAWSRRSLCLAKEAFYDLLICYSEVDQSTIIEILDTEPDSISVSSDEEHPGLRIPLVRRERIGGKEQFERLLGLPNLYKYDTEHGGMVKDIALLTFLTTKELPPDARAEVKVSILELYYRLDAASGRRITSHYSIPKTLHVSSNILGAIRFQEVLCLYRMTMMLPDQSLRFFRFDLLSQMPIRDECLQYFLRKLGDWCFKDGPVNGLQRTNRMQMLANQIKQVKPMAIERLGEAFWEVGLDFVEYNSGKRRLIDCSGLKERLQELMKEGERTRVVHANPQLKDRVNRILT